MYAGDLSPADCFDALENDLMAVLIDVRTPPEWYFVGQPKVTRMANISWKVFPNMMVNPDFEQQLRQAGVTEDHKIYFLCKTGGRSAEAAMAMTQAGFTQCFNVANGFDGDQNEQGQRGSVNGWKASALPWAQQ